MIEERNELKVSNDVLMKGCSSVCSTPTEQERLLKLFKIFIQVDKLNTKTEVIIIQYRKGNKYMLTFRHRYSKIISIIRKLMSNPVVIGLITNFLYGWIKDSLMK